MRNTHSFRPSVKAGRTSEKRDSGLRSSRVSARGLHRTNLVVCQSLDRNRRAQVWRNGRWQPTRLHSQRAGRPVRSVRARGFSKPNSNTVNLRTSALLW